MCGQRTGETSTSISRERGMNKHFRAILFFGINAAACHLGYALAQGVEQQDSSVHPGKLVEFDAPGAATSVSTVCGGNCGTFAYANNDHGVVVGSFTDEFVVPHGFVRKRDGRIITFDAPGAGLGSFLNEGTVV